MTPISHISRKATPRRVLSVLLVCAAALCAGMTSNRAWAAEAPAAKELPGRYLIIVDTSFSMHRRAANVQKVVGDLLLSGMNGQLRPGDTMGVWTFNEDLNAGSFPLQLWTPQTRQRIAAGVVEFLQRQRFEKQTQLDKALAAMTGVVKESDKITVLLISDGDDKVSGTPFDREVNKIYKLNHAEQRKLRMPFVTVLRARKGAFIGCQVSMPPWPVEFPTFPAEPQVAEPQVAETPPAKEEPKTQLIVTSTVPSLIVVGKKPESAASSATNAAPAEAAKPEPTPAPAPVQPAEIPKPAPIPAATTAPATNPTIVKSPEPAVPQPTQPAESSRVTITTTPQQQAAVVPSAPAKSETTSPPKTETPSSPAAVTVVAPDKLKVQPAPETSPKPAEPVVVTRIEATTPFVAPSPVAPAPAEPVPSPSLPQATPKSDPTSPAPPQTPVVQTAMATPSETVFNRTGILIAGMVLLLVALGLVYALMRRSRTTAQASLITRSMDRDKK